MPTPVRIVDDGWQVDRRVEHTGSLYDSCGRLPAERPEEFNGTVVVEWLNVSGGLDADPDWTQTHNELIRDGFAWVGVSAQAQGVNQLKCSETAPPSLQCPAPGDPTRYASLSHPGDSYSYDIFSQAGQAIRDDSAQLLGGLSPKTLLAAGESQSAARMVTYIDAVQPLVHVYDGFLVHSRGAAGAACRRRLSPRCRRQPDADPHRPRRAGVRVPDRVRYPRCFTACQPDTNVFRQWEAAGTSHFDTYGLLIGPSDTGDGQGGVANLKAMQDPTNIPALAASAPSRSTPVARTVAQLGDLLVEPVGYDRHAASDRAAPADRVNVAVCLRQGRQRQHHRWRALAPGRRADCGARGYRQHRRKQRAISAFCALFGSTVPYTPAQLAACTRPRPVRVGLE